jgi:NTP pyrophosphatase (non-canonical NTP hydrolase)
MMLEKSMEFNDYQEKSKHTDQFSDKNRSTASAFWNLMEKVGVLARKYDEQGRLNVPEQNLKPDITDHLGDILWYVSAIARNYDINLNEVAEGNLAKTRERWGGKTHSAYTFDDDFPDTERFPEVCVFKIEESSNGDVQFSTDMAYGGALQLGDRITDNSREDDGYRFHDVFHLAYAAKLGWSPVVRRMLKRKRKSKPTTDEVEDGARAANIEEGLTAIIFETARHMKYFEGMEQIPFELLKMIERSVRGLEVHQCTYELWNEAVLAGYEVFRQLREKRRGVVTMDVKSRKLLYADLPRT